MGNLQYVAQYELTAITLRPRNEMYWNLLGTGRKEESF